MDARFDWRRAARAAAMAACVLLAACQVKLVSDYDEQIDTGLSRMNTEITAFVDKMISEAGTPQGTWAANKDFYFQEEAEADTLIARAEAHAVLHTCPSTKAIASAVTAMSPSTEVMNYVNQYPQDDCSVILMKLIRDAIANLEKFHQEQGAAGIPAIARGPLLDGGVGSLIHSAMVVELAKKNAQMKATPGGS